MGIDEQTILKIRGHLDRLNLERDTALQYDAEAKRKKFLSLITFPPLLAQKVPSPLPRKGGERQQAGCTLAGPITVGRTARTMQITLYKAVFDRAQVTLFELPNLRDED